MHHTFINSIIENPNQKSVKLYNSHFIDVLIFTKMSCKEKSQKERNETYHARSARHYIMTETSI